MKNRKWTNWVAAMALALPLTGAEALLSAESDERTGSSQTAANVSISSAAGEVVRLAGAGVGDDVVLAYIQNSQVPFNLSADDVLYLKDVGLPSSVISAMLSRDTSLRNQQPQPASTSESETPGPEPATASETTTSAGTVVVKNPPPDVAYFYNDLLPYGTWADLAGVGWCWQPRAAVVSQSWRPYSDSGHWVYTDAGWFWQSDYSWGWAPFHYGRWFLHDRVGWVWVPDRNWAPAWVVWRISGTDCGWAPLPPHAVLDARAGWRFKGVTVGASFDFGLRPEHFTFVAMRDFAERDLRPCRLPPTEARNVYQRTTIVNNYSVNNRTVVNQGLPLQRVTASARSSIPRATVRDLPAGSRTGSASHLAGQGQSVVYRPELKAPSKAPTVVAQKVDERHPAIQHPVVNARPAQPPRTGPPSPWSPAPNLNRQPTQSPKGSQQTSPYSGSSQNAVGPRNSQSGNSAGNLPGTSGGIPGQGRQGSRPGSSFQPESGNPSSGASPRPSDASKQPRPPTTGSGSGKSGTQSTPPARSSESGKQPSRSGSEPGPASQSPGSGNKSSDPGKQGARSTPSYQPGSAGSGFGPPSRSSDQGGQPSRSVPSYGNESKGPSSSSSTRPPDQGRQQSRSGPSYQPGSSASSSGTTGPGSGPPRKNEQP